MPHQVDCVPRIKAEPLQLPGFKSSLGSLLHIMTGLSCLSLYHNGQKKGRNAKRTSLKKVSPPPRTSRDSTHTQVFVKILLFLLSTQTQFSVTENRAPGKRFISLQVVFVEARHLNIQPNDVDHDFNLIWPEHKLIYLTSKGIGMC